MIYTAELMQNLMMDLLDLAQLENNTFKMNKAFFSIFQAVDQAFQVLSHLADNQNVKLVAPTCAPDEEPYLNQLFGDKNRFIQVIINFVSNSIKFSPPNSEVQLNLKVLQTQVVDDPRFMSNQFEDDLA